MRAIYTPRGRALEYAELALNLYTGCAHGCVYCYAPNSLRKQRDLFHSRVEPRSGILEAVKKDAAKFSSDHRAVHLCFHCDPYPPPPCRDVTRATLQILEERDIKVQLLTKAGSRAARDFDILERNSDWSFGTTLLFMDDARRQEWEPFAASVTDRIETIIEAKRRGIRTWVSVEPVISTGEALAVIDALSDHVDLWKVGKLNHMPEIERRTDWRVFLDQVEKRLQGREYIIKRDLREAARR